VSSLDASMQLLDREQAEPLFFASCPVTLLEHFRVPYAVTGAASTDGVEELAPSGGSPRLFWTSSAATAPAAAVIAGPDGGIPIFAAILHDDHVRPMLSGRGGQWRRARDLNSPRGERLGSIWRDDHGNVFLPFDPNEVIESFWSERYLRAASGKRARGLRRALMLAYYRLRPFLARRLQIWLRRWFARLQARSAFPRWPAETGLHDFFDLMFGVLSTVAGGPVPRMAAWPDGHRWALVLTHDVEEARGLASLDRVLELERRHDVRSSFNLVPKRYPIAGDCVSRLTEQGFEVGVHGVCHDGRDLESLAIWTQRLPEVLDAAERWGAVGFRSAALHREWDWIRLHGLDYDSSCPDTDPFEPQHGGCCTWLPFFNGEVVELPVTLPQDHTLFVILRHRDGAAWRDKAEFLRARGGLAMIDTHPDYLIDETIFAAYAAFLEHFSCDPTAWKALPREVSAWWRRRATSWLEFDGDEWQVAGPAAGEARVELAWGEW
jgi:peptidoglycan/xylan/chitin deacetylase (PgdA/CDA1 family)